MDHWRSPEDIGGFTILRILHPQIAVVTHRRLVDVSVRDMTYIGVFTAGLCRATIPSAAIVVFLRWMVSVHVVGRKRRATDHVSASIDDNLARFKLRGSGVWAGEDRIAVNAEVL